MVYLLLRPLIHEIWSCPGNTVAQLVRPIFFIHLWLYLLSSTVVRSLSAGLSGGVFKKFSVLVFLIPKRSNVYGEYKCEGSAAVNS